MEVFSKAPQEFIWDVLSDFSLNHAANSFILDSGELEVVTALYKDYDF